MLAAIVFLLLFCVIFITQGGDSHSLPTNEYDALNDLWIATKGSRWAYLTPFESFGYPWNFTNPQFSNPCNRTFHWQGVNCSSTCVDSPCHVVTLILQNMVLSGNNRMKLLSAYA